MIYLVKMPTTSYNMDLDSINKMIMNKKKLEIKIKEDILEINKQKLAYIQFILDNTSAKVCRNDGTCTRKDCKFLHPKGEAKSSEVTSAKVCRNDGTCTRKSSKVNSIFYDHD
jgi:hypothetical protein